MAIHHITDAVSFSDLKNDLNNYNKDFFKRDAFAAIQVALLTVPQAIAYAIVAGLPVSCGVFAAIYSSFLAALFGSSRHLISGPSNAISILIQAGTSEILFSHFRDLTGVDRDIMAVQVLTQLTLIAGFFQLMAAFFNLGRLTQFVSYSVIVGYLLGTTFAVVINQLYSFLGIERQGGVHSLYENGLYLFTHVFNSHLATSLVGIGSLLLLIFLKKVDKRIPAGVVILICSATIAHYLDLTSYTMDEFSDVSTVQLVGDNGELFELLPLFHFPYINTGIMNALLPFAFALALLSVMETLSVSKSIASNSGQHLSVNQEIFGIGIGNFLSSFIGAMPVSGSAIRSGVNFHNGAQTRIAALMNCFFAWLIIFILDFYIIHIPLASLAALILVGAVKIVNLQQLKICLKATGSDALVFWVTFVSCLFFSLDIAFYMGVALSIIFYLNRSAVPQLVEYDIDESGELKNLDLASAVVHKTIRIIKVEGELFFGAADIFQSTLKTLAQDDTETKVIILQLKNARDIDATACLALQQLYDYLKNSGRFLIACGLTAPVWEVLSESGVIQHIGKKNVFFFDERHPHDYLHKALRRAKHLIQKQKPIIKVEEIVLQEVPKQI